MHACRREQTEAARLLPWSCRTLADSDIEVVVVEEEEEEDVRTYARRERAASSSHRIAASALDGADLTWSGRPTTVARVIPRTLLGGVPFFFLARHDKIETQQGTHTRDH